MGCSYYFQVRFYLQEGQDPALLHDAVERLTAEVDFSDGIQVSEDSVDIADYASYSFGDEIDETIQSICDTLNISASSIGTADDEPFADFFGVDADKLRSHHALEQINHWIERLSLPDSVTLILRAYERLAAL